jgi:hypothetical protein
VTVLGGAWHLHCHINQSSLLDASHSTGKGIYIGKGIKLHPHSSISTGKGKTTTGKLNKLTFKFGPEELMPEDQKAKAEAHAMVHS